MICPKCHNRGTRYQTDGSITTIKPCDCQVAIDQQANFSAWMEEFRINLDESLLRVGS